MKTLLELQMGMLKRTFNPETGCPKGTSANGCAGCPGRKLELLDERQANHVGCEWGEYN